MELHELSPFPISIDWEGVEIQLKPFDLRSMTWAERFFSLEGQGGFERMNQTLKSEHGQKAFENAAVEIVFYLAGDQFSKIPIFKNEYKKEVERTWKERIFSRPWQPLLKEKTVPSKEPRMVECGCISTCEILKTEIRNHKNKVEIFNGFIEAIHQTFKISFSDQKQKEPELTGGAIFEFFKAQEAEEKQEVKINWAEMFMKFHAVGGMSITEFYSLTFKQIEAISEEIGYIKADDFRSMAIANGIPAKQIKIPRRKEKTLIH